MRLSLRDSARARRPSGHPDLETWVRLLRPFRRDYARYLGGTIFRQALLVLGGYSMVWAIRLSTGNAAIPLWGVIAALIVLDFLYLAVDIHLSDLFARRLSFPLFGHLRSAALEKVFQMPLEWHHEQSSGALVGKVNNGVGRVVQTGEALSRELCPALIRTGFSLVPLLLLSLNTTPILIAALGIFAWLTIQENAKRESFRKDRHANYVRDSARFTEYVQAVQPVIQFGQGRRLLAEYGELQQRIIDQGVEEMRVAHAYAWRRNTVLSIARRICQGIWIWELLGRRMDAASVMYLSMLTEELLASFWGYAGLLERIHEGMQPAKILIRLLREKPSIMEEPGAQPVVVPEKVAIHLLNVRFSYLSRKKLIGNLTLSIEEGRILGVVGRSGSGKTTIQNLLPRIFDIEDGSILVCGTDIRKWPLEQLRAVFSCVSQGGGVFFSDMTIMDTIRFARPDADFAEVVDAANCACIHEDILRMPGGYATKLRQGGVNLSKGQQQRIALAQALIALEAGRKILVLDEFTSQLDSETESRILNNLAPRLAGRTAIIIAHRLSTVRRIADRIVVLQDGAVLEEGSHQELVSRNGWYASMARLQAVT